MRQLIAMLIAFTLSLLCIAATKDAATAPPKLPVAIPSTTTKIEEKKGPVLQKKIAPPPQKKVVDKKMQQAVVKPDPKKTDANLISLANAIQRQYNRTKSATFNFRQRYVHPFLSGQDSMNNSAGNVAYDKNNGRMMWNYSEPNERKKIFIINREKFIFYSVSDNIAYTHNCYDQDTLSASIAFLLGTGNLIKSFTITPFVGDVPNKELLWISLIPKEASAPVKKISLGATVDGKVLESVVDDPSGGKNYFTFLDFKVNPKIPDSVFNFSLPKGVKEQPMPNVQCAPKNEAKPKVTPQTAPKANSKAMPSKKF